MSTHLTASSTIGTWLDDSTGGPLIRGLLAAGGMDASALAPVYGMALGSLVDLSQGKMPRSVVDGLVLQANGGVMPEEDTSGVWQERIVTDRFTGRTVIVTGAASGIGRAVASRVAREGGRVIAVDIAAERLGGLTDELTGSDVRIVAADLTADAGVAAVLDAAGDRIDALANVAGINDAFMALHEVTDEVWARVFAVNVEAPMRLSRAVLPAMMAAGRGSIVNVASEAALRGNASGTAYTASKHAVIGLTRSAAFLYGPMGIRVNAVAPGGVATGMPSGGQESEFAMARLKPFHSLLPGIALAPHLAASITFLLSDDGININGAVLASDTGWSVQ